MDDINWMISLLSEFLSEEKEELVFLELWDKVPDIVPFEEVFHAQLEFKNERKMKYINVYGGDPRSGNTDAIRIMCLLNPQNGVAFKELCKTEGIKPATKTRQLIHDYLLQNNIKPFYKNLNKKYYGTQEPVMEPQPFDLEKAHELQFEGEAVNLEEDIECPEAHHKTQRQIRWYWRRNTKRYW